MTGILIIAVGNRGYGTLAGTLAMSIRACGCELPITLATQDETISRLNVQYLSYFTDIIVMPQEYITNHGDTCYIKAKAHLDDLTPYEYTLFIDADILILDNGKLQEYIDSLHGVDFACKNSGYKLFSDELQPNQKQWASLLEVKEAFQFTDEEIWDVHSEFIWWKKGHPVFAQWVKNFSDIRVAHTIFADCIPDELPLWIALAQTKMKPHFNHWHPTYWPSDGKVLRLAELRSSNYCGLSLGGKKIPEIQEKNYNILLNHYKNTMGLEKTFAALPKNKWLRERHTY